MWASLYTGRWYNIYQVIKLNMKENENCKKTYIIILRVSKLIPSKIITISNQSGVSSFVWNTEWTYKWAAELPVFLSFCISRKKLLKCFYSFISLSTWTSKHILDVTSPLFRFISDFRFPQDFSINDVIAGWSKNLGFRFKLLITTRVFAITAFQVSD